MKKICLLITLFLTLFINIVSFAEEPEIIDIGTCEKDIIPFLPVYLAENMGFLKSELFEFHLKNHDNYYDTLQSLINGKMQYIASTFDQVIRYKTQEKKDLKDIRLIASFVKIPMSALVIGEKFRTHIKDTRDLKGLRIGIASAGSQYDYILKFILNKNGITPSQLKIMSVGSRNIASEIERNIIHAAMIPTELANFLTKNKKVQILIDLSTPEATNVLFSSLLPWYGIFTTRDILKQKPDEVKALLSSFKEAKLWMDSHSSDEIAEIFETRIKNKSLFLESLTLVKAYYESHILPTHNEILAALNVLQTGGAFFKKKISPSFILP